MRVAILFVVSAAASKPLFEPGFIDAHNAKMGAWTAGKTPFASLSEEDFSRFMGDNPKPT